MLNLWINKKFQPNDRMLLLILPVCAYLAGSVSSAIIVSRIMGLPDPRSSGSNNPGATNVLRLGGKKAAIITLIGDLLKGLLPVVIARMFTDDSVTLALVGIGAFLGHLYPIWFGFKGGKGVATAAGVFIGLSGVLTISLLAIWFAIAVLTRYSSLAALVACAVAPFLVLLFGLGTPMLVLASVIAVFLFWRHRANITRLLDGSESKINLSGKS